MPWIAGDLTASKAPGVFGNGLAILADDNPIGIGPHVDRPPDGAGHHAVVIVVEAHQTSLGDWTLLTKVATSCDRILIAGGANVEAEWEQGPAV